MQFSSVSGATNQMVSLVEERRDYLLRKDPSTRPTSDCLFSPTTKLHTVHSPIVTSQQTTLATKREEPKGEFIARFVLTAFL